METKKLALSAASLTLVLSFLACDVLGGGGGAPTATPPGPGEAGQPAEAGETGETVEATATHAVFVPTNVDGAETTLIPGGTFWMGSADTDTLAEADEKPRHQVTLPSFPIYTYEVTNEMYARCVEAGSCTPIPEFEGSSASEYGDPAYADHPVRGVDWNMANEYCTWAGSRLPTEAEWEYAARGADSLIYPWGSDDPACDLADMAGCLTPEDTVKVGSFRLGNSPFGVWDMAGNVWEWTHDWYGPDYYAVSASTSPLGPSQPGDPENPQKVVRGGGMTSEAPSLRGAARTGARPLRSYDELGFRCVAASALDLPADYVEVPEGHEWGPRIPLDHPDGEGAWWTRIGAGAFTCPDAGGRVGFSMAAHSSVVPTTFSVSVGGVPLACSFDQGAGSVDCSGTPPPEYDTWVGHAPIQVCFQHAYGSGCAARFASKPTDCTPSGEPTTVPFSFVGAGCHDENHHVYFIIDTGLAWLVPGAGFTYSAADAERSYTCSVHPTIAGRLYCSGGEPESPGTLNVCVDQDGPAPMMCGSFSDWPAQAAIIPDCAPPPPAQLPPCSSYTSAATCPSDRCVWVPAIVRPPYCAPK